MFLFSWRRLNKNENTSTTRRKQRPKQKTEKKQARFIFSSEIVPEKKTHYSPHKKGFVHFVLFVKKLYSSKQGKKKL